MHYCPSLFRCKDAKNRKTKRSMIIGTLSSDALLNEWNALLHSIKLQSQKKLHHNLARFWKRNTVVEHTLPVQCRKQDCEIPKGIDVRFRKKTFGMYVVSLYYP